MANLPHQHPALSMHLTDRALTPLISSSPPAPDPDPDPNGATTASPSQRAALTSLATTALSLHDAAARLGLGSPQRCLVEYGPGGPLLIQTFLDPAAASPRFGQPSSSAPRPPPPRRPPRPPPPPATATATAAPPAVATAAAAAGTEPPPASGRNKAPGKSDDGPEVALADAAVGLKITLAGAGSGDGGGNNGSEDSIANREDDGGREPGVTEEATPGAENRPDAAPMLVGVVLAPSADDAAEARRATARLERVAREIQAVFLS